MKRRIVSQRVSVGRSIALVASLLYCGCAATEGDEAPPLSPEKMEVERTAASEAAAVPKSEPVRETAAESALGVEATRAAEAPEEVTLAGQQAVSARWRAMWLVAGSPPPPGLPTALLNARNERSEGALALVRAILTGEEADAFRAALTEIFVQEETPDLLWCAVARASAALSLHETAPHLVANLESS